MLGPAIPFELVPVAATLRVAVHAPDAHGFGDSAVTTEPAPMFAPVTTMPMTSAPAVTLETGSVVEPDVFVPVALKSVPVQ